MKKLKAGVLAMVLTVAGILSSAAEGSAVAAETALFKSAFSSAPVTSESGSPQFDAIEAAEENDRPGEGAAAEAAGETSAEAAAEPAGETSAEAAAEPAGETSAEAAAKPAGESVADLFFENASEQAFEESESGNALQEGKADAATVLMPEFFDQKTVGKYVVKIHAKEGVFPAGTAADVRIMREAEAQPYSEKVERTADVGRVIAVFDIGFTDVTGKEIQPAGMVDLSFENAVEEGEAMSVYHAVDGSADKIEPVPAETENDSVLFQSDSFSPFILLAASREPNWIKGGGGIRDVSDEIKVIHKDENKYYYGDYGFYNNDENYPDVTFCFGMYVDGQRVGWSYCVDPLKSGYDVEGKWAGKVYEVSAPMFVKALYYGASGKDLSVIKEATGYTSYEALNIITHVTASEIYARLGYSQSQAGDGFLAANSVLRNAVYKYAKAIEDLPTPSGYYGYVTEENGDGKQNFAFGSFSLTDGSVKVKKESANPGISKGNSCYSLANAEYLIYTSESAARARGEKGQVKGGKLLTDADGNSNSVTIKEGTYYLIEGTAPRGFVRSDTIYKFTVDNAETTVVKVKDQPGYAPPDITIDKKCRNGDGKNINSLEGTEFSVNYYSGYFDASSLPQKADKTWVIKTIKTADGVFRASLDSAHLVRGDAFFRNENSNVLPLGTITIKETKVPEGYKNDGSFGGADLYVGQIRVNDAGTDTILADIQGERTKANHFEVSDSPLPPEISTQAVDRTSDAQMAYAGGNVAIEDTVLYKNLVVGSEYTLKGKLVDKATGETIKDRVGKEITAERAFTAEAMEGRVKMLFSFPADSTFAGRSAVVFETVEYNGQEVVSHAAIEEESQTIHFPQIRTSAVSADTEDHIMSPAEEACVTDTVSYSNLIPGKEYTLKGILMVKSTGSPLTVKGEEIAAEVRFTPDKAEGKTQVSFCFDATGFENEDFVAFEELYLGTNLIADHKDGEDQAQTIHVPRIETDACDKETEKKNTLAAKDRVIIDKVTYKNLIPGKTYEISGEVKIKPQEETEFDEAVTVPSQITDAQGEGDISFDSEKVTFVPAGKEGDRVSGQILVSFKIDASELAGEEIVVGETIRYKGVEITVHRDLKDERQNDLIPKGQTIAVDADTGIKNTLAASNRVFKDTFRYENLLPGETYRFTGKVMAVKERDAEGNEILEEIASVMTDENGVPVEKGCIEFIPEKREGTLDLYFSIDAAELENRDVTVFETVTLDGNPVIIHEIMDGSQTIYVPEGATFAVDSESMDRIAMADGEITVIDTFVYKNLIPGTEYTVKGRVMRKRDAAEISSRLMQAAFEEETEGAEISVSAGGARFIPATEDGAIVLTFVFDGSALKGEEIVLFERVCHNDSEVIVHENIDDASQTILLPDGHTEATDPDTGGHTMKTGEKSVIRDRFFYKNLLPGAEYVIRGKVMLKPSDGEKATEIAACLTDAGGKEVKEWRFTPAQKDGSEDLYFAINSDKLSGQSVVLYETLEFINPALGTRTTLLVHGEIEDEKQTIHFPSPHHKPPEVTRTGDESAMGIWIFALAAAVAGLVAALLFRKKGL